VCQHLGAQFCPRYSIAGLINCPGQNLICNLVEQPGDGGIAPGIAESGGHIGPRAGGRLRCLGGFGHGMALQKADQFRHIQTAHKTAIKTQFSPQLFGNCHAAHAQSGLRPQSGGFGQVHQVAQRLSYLIPQRPADQDGNRVFFQRPRHHFLFG